MTTSFYFYCFSSRGIEPSPIEMDTGFYLHDYASGKFFENWINQRLKGWSIHSSDDVAVKDEKLDDLFRALQDFIPYIEGQPDHWNVVLGYRPRTTAAADKREPIVGQAKKGDIKDFATKLIDLVMRARAEEKYVQVGGGL
ncbi:MAG: hypothetical protein ACREVL_14255 [Solimonas sp.]